MKECHYDGQNVHLKLLFHTVFLTYIQSAREQIELHLSF